MEAIIFIGIQASGKSSFYKLNFFNSHVRISMDLLRTRKREKKFLDLCLQTNTRFVVDNTNPTVAERQRYLALAKAHQYKVTGYFFETTLADALARNKKRKGKEQVKEVGLYACRKKLALPSFAEGFDHLFSVQLKEGKFVVEEWRQEQQGLMTEEGNV